MVLYTKDRNRNKSCGLYNKPVRNQHTIRTMSPTSSDSQSNNTLNTPHESYIPMSPTSSELQTIHPMSPTSSDLQTIHPMSPTSSDVQLIGPVGPTLNTIHQLTDKHESCYF